ncbi:exopolysaccharide biosynthesis protein [Rhodobacteraceae bacterium CCMM004]|nr:exopolysaccharide biosynthesis protein [Rhodobacteraceae bacterium CCMM004]
MKPAKRPSGRPFGSDGGDTGPPLVAGAIRGPSVPNGPRIRVSGNSDVLTQMRTGTARFAPCFRLSPGLGVWRELASGRQRPPDPTEPPVEHYASPVRAAAMPHASVHLFAHPVRWTDRIGHDMKHAATETSSDPAPFSAALRDLPDLAPGRTAGPSLAMVLDRLGTRVHGSALLLLALPDAVPLPIPSAGAVLGIPLILVSTHLVLYGEVGTLPARALRWRLPLPVVEVIADRIAPVFARLERWSRPRLPLVAGMERPVGVAALFLSVLLFLPIPFVNLPIAIGLAVLGWGLIQWDGVIIAVGIAYALAILVILGVAYGMLRNAVF